MSEKKIELKNSDGNKIAQIGTLNLSDNNGFETAYNIESMLVDCREDCIKFVK